MPAPRWLKHSGCRPIGYLPCFQDSLSYKFVSSGIPPPSMTTTALNVSMPAGRHEVTVGASLVRALKARKPDGGQVKQNNKFDREFYSVRCQSSPPLLSFQESSLTACADNFKPESIDLSKPGNIETRKTKDGQSSVTVTRPSSQVRHHTMAQPFHQLQPPSCPSRTRTAHTTSRVQNKRRGMSSVSSSTMKRPGCVHLVPRTAGCHLRSSHRRSR